MILKNTTLIFAVCICLLSCKNIDPNLQIDEGHIENSVYKNQNLGWEIEIPKEWDIVTMEETDAFEEKGLEILDGAITEEDIASSELKNLISFKKNIFNIFQSDLEAFEIEYEGEYKENVGLLKDLIHETYQEQGITVTASEISTETIDELEFYQYEFTLYGTNNEVILNQIIFSRWINGYAFGVTINYNNEANKNEMLTAFRNSKFIKQKQ